MLRSVFAKTVYDRRRATFGWTISLVSFAVVYLLFWPTVRDQPELQKLVDSYPEALKAVFGFDELFTPEGYLNTELFSFMVPLAFLIGAIGFGSVATTAEERDKTADLLLANPVSRTRVVLEKFLAYLVTAFAMGAGLFVSLAVGSRLVGMDLSLEGLAAAVLGPVLLGALFAALALVLGAATGRRGVSIAVSALVAVAAFLVNSLAQVVDLVEPFRVLSPLYHAGGYGPLREGFAAGRAGLLAFVTAVLLASAVALFDRRDLAS